MPKSRRVKKLDKVSSDSSAESSREEQSETPEGFCLFDIAILASVFKSFSCALCRYGHIVFKDDENPKMGFATLLVLKCASKKCNYLKCFYTSSKVDGSQAFEVNNRIVLAMRNLGIRHQSLANFAGAMNILAPMNENSYHDHVAVVCNAAGNEA